jgi:hypothetical protein
MVEIARIASLIYLVEILKWVCHAELFAACSLFDLFPTVVHNGERSAALMRI